MTTADINNTLRLQTQFTVGNTGTPPPDTVIIKDLSTWSTLVSASTDKVNIILQIKNSAGQIVYQNTGWVAGTFTSPDLFFGTSPVTTTTAKTLLYDANNALITGTYTVESQVQVVVNYATSPVITLGGVTYSPLLCADYLQINLNPSIDFAPYCDGANITVSDSTNYGTYTSITRAIKVTPPVEANQSPFTSASNSVLVTAILSPAPYQGEIHNVVTYTSGSTTVISYVNYFQNFDTNCDQSFCELYCCLKDLYAKREAASGRNSAKYAVYDQQFTAGLQILALCIQAKQCSDDVRLASYIEQFYVATGCSKDCGCGCSDKPTPVVPVIPSQGPAGSNGVGISTATVNGSGHLIITLTNNTVIDAGVVAGAAGPAGADGTNGTNGADGDNGSSALWTGYINYPNSGAGAADKVARTIPANTFVNAGDRIRIGIVLKFTGNFGALAIPVKVGTTTLVTLIQSTSSVTNLLLDLDLQYDAGNLAYIINLTSSSSFGQPTPALAAPATPITFDATIANDITVDLSSYTGHASAVYMLYMNNELIKRI